MSKTNLQVRIPEEIDVQITRLAPGSKSSFVREAVLEKIQREKDLQLEAKWIAALAKHSDSGKEDKDWSKAEAWGAK